jgi:hypothetical protein
MRPAQVGVIVGAILGLALVLEGFGDMLVVGLAAAIGWVVVRVATGELDVSELVERTRPENRRR